MAQPSAKPAPPLWSQQLRIQLPKPSPSPTGDRPTDSPASASHLTGDKIILPASHLQAILSASEAAAAAAASSAKPSSRSSNSPLASLPPRQQPLTFRLVNPQTGRSVYAGVREFSAADGSVIISPWLASALEIFTNDTHALTPTTDTLAVHLVALPRGSAVTLFQMDRPQLEDGKGREKGTRLPAEDPNWKPILEALLRQQFTTLTRGETLTVPVTGQTAPVQFLVKGFGGGNGDEGDLLEAVCIVDTDLAVDIVKNETIRSEGQTLGKDSDNPTSAPPLLTKLALTQLDTLPSGEGEIRLSQMSRDPRSEVVGQVSAGEYASYLVQGWAPNVLHPGSSLVLSLYDEGPVSPPPSAITPSPSTTGRKFVHWDSSIAPTESPAHLGNNANQEDEQNSLALELFASPFSDHHRSIPRQNSYVWTDLTSRLGGHESGSTAANDTPGAQSMLGQIRISGTNVQLSGAAGIRVSVYYPQLGDGSGGQGDYDGEMDSNAAASTRRKYVPKRLFRLAVKVDYSGQSSRASAQSNGSSPAPGSVSSNGPASFTSAQQSSQTSSACPNCRLHFPPQSLHIHTVFCIRHIFACKKCPAVIPRSYKQALQEHWHCELEGCPMSVPAGKNLRANGSGGGLGDTPGSQPTVPNTAELSHSSVSAFGFSHSSRSRHLARFHTDVFAQGIFSAPVKGKDADLHPRFVTAHNSSPTKKQFRREGVPSGLGQTRSGRVVRCSDCVRFACRSVHALALHRTSMCPARLIICRFCKLEVPQGSIDRDVDRRKGQAGREGDASDSSKSDYLLDLDDDFESGMGTPFDPTTDPDGRPSTSAYPSFPRVLQSQLLVAGDNLTAHEFLDGSRTTDCHICNRPVRMFSLETHIQTHRFLQDQKPAPGRGVCMNRVCGAVLPAIQDQVAAARVESILTAPTFTSTAAINSSNTAMSQGGFDATATKELGALIPKIAVSLCVNCAPALMLPTEFGGTKNIDSSEDGARMLYRRVERAYMRQQMQRGGTRSSVAAASKSASGCGRTWCRNWACAAGRSGVKIVHRGAQACKVDDSPKLKDVLTGAFFNVFATAARPLTNGGGWDLSEWPIPLVSAGSSSSTPAPASDSSAPAFEPGIYLCASTRAIQARALEARIQVALSKLISPGMFMAADEDGQNRDLRGDGGGDGTGAAASKIDKAATGAGERTGELLRWWNTALEKTGAAETGLELAEVVLVVTPTGARATDDVAQEAPGSATKPVLTGRVDWTKCSSGIPVDGLVKAREWLRENAPGWVSA